VFFFISNNNNCFGKKNVKDITLSDITLTN